MLIHPGGEPVLHKYITGRYTPRGPSCVLTATHMPLWWAVCISVFLKNKNHGSAQHRIGERKKINPEASKKIMPSTHIWRTYFVWLKLSKALKVRDTSRSLQESQLSVLLISIPTSSLQRQATGNFRFYSLRFETLGKLWVLKLQCKILTFTTAQLIFWQPCNWVTLT